MKVDINNEIFAANKIRPQTIKQNLKNAGKADADNTSSSQILHSLSNKRVYIDAIVISQMAQNFFQTAILISSRLKNIATEAIVSGNIDLEKLDEALTGINSSLNELQERQLPVSSLLQNYSTGGFKSLNIDFLQVNEDLNSISKIGTELFNREQPDLKRIDRIQNNFFNNISAINNFVDLFSAEFSLVDLQNINVDNSQVYADRTNSMVINYPQTALNSQGNISHEAVTKFAQNR